MLTSGPPELPPKIAASWPIQRTIEPTSSPSSVMRLNGQNMPGMIISVLLTIPIVTDCDSASGLPRASTRSPTFSVRDVAERGDRKRARRRRPQPEHGDVRQRIGADELGGNLFAVGERAGDRARAPGDVMVGDDEAVRRDDGAAAGRLALELAAVLEVDRDDMDADQAGRDLAEGGLDLDRLFRRSDGAGLGGLRDAGATRRIEDDSRQALCAWRDLIPNARRPRPLAQSRCTAVATRADVVISL